MQGHPLAVLAEPGDGVTAQDHRALRARVLLKQLLGADLGNGQHERVRRVEHAEVEPALQHPEVPPRHRRPLVEEQPGQAAHGQHLDRARMDTQRLRVRAALRRPFQDHDWHPGQRQLRRGPQPDGTRADHDDVLD
ncbi:hypothetical protein GCM10020001_116510 [Nonomuraea salmonea]